MIRPKSIATVVSALRDLVWSVMSFSVDSTVISLIVLYFLGAHGLLLIGLALAISGIVSFVVLSRQRDAMSSALATRIGGFRNRLDEGTRAEDDD